MLLLLLPLKLLLLLLLLLVTLAKHSPDFGQSSDAACKDCPAGTYK
jgi:hypothetical protein